MSDAEYERTKAKKIDAALREQLREPSSVNAIYFVQREYGLPSHPVGQSVARSRLAITA